MMVLEQRAVSCEQGKSVSPLKTGQVPSRIYLTQSFLNSFLHKSNPTHIRELILNVSTSKGCVCGFVGGLTSAKQL